ncbi:hypothetical protein ACWCQL_25175 [Streptomyces sp. NPDC002073]|uniref:hypothetical protein n=1 Tax=Streptomyces sp. NBC_00239 TaxID=2903640 RepID=UPI002E2E5C9F|nr:hypothetical protein [Streptomyces sp. NBC_00239]
MSPQEQHGSRGYSVPTGRPFQLKELHGKIGSLGDQVKELYEGAHPAEYEPVADALYAAFQTAAGLAPVKSYTGCPEHPNGALDPESPDGWGRCLICNDRRRRGLRRQGGRGAGPAPADQQRRLGYPVPDPPYSVEQLRACVAKVQEQAFHLGVGSPGDAFVDVADDLHRAFIVARELSRPRNASGCAEHPGAPIDPDAPPGEACIFCAGRKKRAQRPPQTPEMLPRIRRGERRQLGRRFDRPSG